jgi:hypothetical protein
MDYRERERRIGEPGMNIAPLMPPMTKKNNTTSINRSMWKTLGHKKPVPANTQATRYSGRSIAFFQMFLPCRLDEDFVKP